MNKYKNINKNYKLLLLLIPIILLFSLFLPVSSQDAADSKTNSQFASTSVPKNLLIELFINADCTTCPKAAFCLEELAWTYDPGKVILVEEHIWGDGHDIPETNARYDWYIGNGVKGTPDAFFNGLSERIQGLCCDCGDIEENVSAYQEIIDKQLDNNSPIKIHAEYSICGGKIIVQGDINNTSHSMLHNKLLSGMVYYEGDESELFYLVKDIFENQDICQLAPMEEKKFSFVSELDLSDVEDSELDRYYCVVFVQDKLTKEVLQSYLAQ
jgi:hypothetical protein